MIDCRLIEKLENIFKEEKFGFGNTNILVKVSYGSIKVEEFNEEDYITVEYEVPDCNDCELS